ncbi:MAG: amino acid/amide transporter ATP-binding protein 1, family [Frankiales bacterium]|nr:amino acid/amide transporter ATP-binding protein 1, family [Frankiales bacterium]
MLKVEEVSVRFGGVQAVAGMSLEAPPGRVTGLIGPNGAGKTTLFNVITGLQKPNTGRVLLGDRDLTKASTAKRARAGVGRTFQRLEVFGSLTVYDNVLLAAELAHVKNPSAAAHQLLERVGLGGFAAQQAGVLPTGMARLLELARALAGNPSVLLLDEPGSGLTEAECKALGDLLLSLTADGTAVLLVEHDMELVMRVCQHVYVLDFGQLLAEGSPAEVSANPAVQIAYLGAEEVSA